MNKIEELRKAYEAVRPGAWAAVDNTDTGAFYFPGWALQNLTSTPPSTFSIALPQEEARLIALAHNLMPLLLEAADLVVEMNGNFVKSQDDRTIDKMVNLAKRLK